LGPSKANKSQESLSRKEEVSAGGFTKGKICLGRRWTVAGSSAEKLGSANRKTTWFRGGGGGV